jgi:hypothetical protein
MAWHRLELDVPGLVVVQILRVARPHYRELFFEAVDPPVPDAFSDSIASWVSHVPQVGYDSIWRVDEALDSKYQPLGGLDVASLKLPSSS